MRGSHWCSPHIDPRGGEYSTVVLERGLTPVPEIGVKLVSNCRKMRKETGTAAVSVGKFCNIIDLIPHPLASFVVSPITLNYLGCFWIYLPHHQPVL